MGGKFMKQPLMSVLLFGYVLAGPMSRGSISPGGSVNLAAYVDVGSLGLTGSVDFTPGIEYAVNDGLFFGGDVSVGWEPGYHYWGLGPTARLCLASTSPWPFIRLTPIYSQVALTASSPTSVINMTSSVGLLMMLGHGVALEPALNVHTTHLLGQRSAYVSSSMSVGFRMGVRSYIYR
jgi:hypothetical protein